LQLKARQQLRGKELLDGALDVYILFTMPIPGSWGKKKQRGAVGQYHVKKLDSDNLIKSVFDSLNKIAWNDNNQVAKVTAVKVYGEQPGIDVTITNL
jgi:Holliday junction resolvase RusA-like endonuclease